MKTPMHRDRTRYDFLDWLRVIAIFVLLFFHTGMLFVGWGWHIENAETIDGAAVADGHLRIACACRCCS